MDRRSFVVASASAIALAPSSVRAAEPLRAAYIAGTAAWPLYVARDRGFFRDHGIDVELVASPGSGAVFKGLDDGSLQIGQASFDNAIAYDGGSGDVPVTARDFVAFLGVDGGSLRLYARPEIARTTDLRGKTIAVDARWTGFTFVVEKLLAQAGLTSDAVAFTVVGGTPLRAKALEAGECAATLLTPPFTIRAADAGLRELADVQKAIGPYQGGAVFVRRSWASAHDQSVVAYAAAYAQALNWLRANRDAATAILAASLQIDPRVATRAADQALGAGGLSLHGELDAAGMRTVGALRSTYAMPHRTVGDLAPYIEERYLQRALAAR